MFFDLACICCIILHRRGLKAKIIFGDNDKNATKIKINQKPFACEIKRDYGIFNYCPLLINQGIKKTT